MCRLTTQERKKNSLPAIYTLATHGRQTGIGLCRVLFSLFSML